MRLTCLIVEKKYPAIFLALKQFYLVFPKKFSCREISQKKGSGEFFRKICTWAGLFPVTGPIISSL